MLERPLRRVPHGADAFAQAAKLLRVRAGRHDHPGLFDGPLRVLPDRSASGFDASGLLPLRAGLSLPPDRVAGGDRTYL